MSTLKNQIEELVGMSINDEDELLAKYEGYAVKHVEVKSKMTANNGEELIDVEFEVETDHPFYKGLQIVSLFGIDELEIDNIELSK